MRAIGFSLLVTCVAQLHAEAPKPDIQTGHSRQVTTVAFSPDSKVLATGSDDKTIVLWNTDTGDQLRVLRGHTSKISGIAFSPEGIVPSFLVSGGFDGTARLWDPSTGQELRALQRARMAPIDSIALSADGKTLATGSFDGTITLWDVATGRELRTLTGHTGDVGALAFSPDGKTLVSGSHDHSVKVWNAFSGDFIRTLTGHSVAVMGVAFSNNGQLIASCGGGYAGHGVVIVWDASSGKKLSDFPPTNDEWISSVAFSPDGKRLIGGTNTRGQALHVWDITANKDLGTLPTETDTVYAVAFSRDRRLFAFGGGNSAVSVRDPNTWKELFLLRGQIRPITALAVSSNGRQMATADQELPDIRLWDLENSTGFRVLTGPSSGVTALAFSPDAKVLASGNDKTVTLWDPTTGGALHQLSGHTATIRCLAFSEDGQYLVSGGDDNTVKLWSLSNNAVVDTFDGHLDAVRAVAFSPDRKWVASASADTTIKIWNLVNRTESPLTLKGHASWVQTLCFSPDGNTLASGSVDKTIRLWNVKTGAEINRLAGHDGAVDTLVYLAGGTQLASAGQDGVIRIWNSQSGKELQTLKGHDDAITGLAVVASGKLSSASLDGQVLFWDVTHNWGDISDARRLVSLIALGNREWACTSPDGHFDTGNLDSIPGLRWTFGDDPFRALPPEIFMRDYFEPRLLTKAFSGEELTKVRPLDQLNRAQPQIGEIQILPGLAGTVTLQVDVSGGVYTNQPRGNRVDKTGAYDLRIFREGQLVGEWPNVTENASELADDNKEHELALWRSATEIVKEGKTTVRFEKLKLPQHSGKVEFSAYAFNDARVKSRTAKQTYQLSQGAGNAQRTAYLVCMGVTVYDNPAWKLEFAAADASKVAVVLGSRFRAAGYNVVTRLLLSDQNEHSARKQDLRDALSQIASRATPDDLVLVSFAGHGYTDKRNEFYLFPRDADAWHSFEPSKQELSKCGSGDELSSWIRRIDAGDMILIIDACHSAASVEQPGFKPGPMGSRGLGQLAYDKRMRVLAASQADDVAIESGKLEHGLLTYALIFDGLENREADFRPKDGQITLGEWLAYAAEDVPRLHEMIRNKKALSRPKGLTQSKAVVFVTKKQSQGGTRDILAATGSSTQGSSLNKKNAFQTPALFDYSGKTTDLVIEKVP